jgi:hypothetical protein
MFEKQRDIDGYQKTHYLTKRGAASDLFEAAEDSFKLIGAFMKELKTAYEECDRLEKTEAVKRYARLLANEAIRLETKVRLAADELETAEIYKYSVEHEKQE